MNEQIIIETLQELFNSDELKGGGRFSVEKICPLVIECEGDWKHTHSRLDYIMNVKGFELQNVEETESDGSDYFTALRTYKLVSPFILSFGTDSGTTLNITLNEKQQWIAETDKVIYVSPITKNDCPTVEDFMETVNVIGLHLLGGTLINK
jgi:hypothetical protein